MSDEMRISSAAMRHADAMVSAFSKRLYNDAFRRAERDGRKMVEIADVDAVAAELAGVSADKTEPAAWGIEENGKLLASYTCEDEESAREEVRRFGDGGPPCRAIPLYRQPQPTLTDSERSALWDAAEAYAGNNDDPECERIATALQGLWQRTR